ncbi:cadherin domain-containing protein, partial [Paenibacillus sp. CCS19]|uniref:beta strand repeat-containing protein n=1 Tax=Paenibacillus sp. CCS19 TaxID=3158387 RepID=UPI00295E34BE
MKHLARWLLAIMLIAVVQPMLVVPKAHAAVAPIPETPISPTADKSYDKYGHYSTGYTDNPGVPTYEHIVGYGRDTSENYGDSFYAAKYPIDSSKINTSKVIEKVELVMFVKSYNDDVDVPAGNKRFKLFTSTDTNWSDGDSHVIDSNTLTPAGIYYTDVFRTSTLVRLDITSYFKAYRAAHPTATEITFYLQGPLEAELPATVTQNGVLTDAFALIYDNSYADSSKRPHLDLFYSANTAPTALTLSSNTIAENMAIGTTVGTFTGTDAEGGTLTYSLAAGGTDNGLFVISGDTLRTQAVFDYEAKNSYSIKVQVTDSEGLFFTKDFTINVSNVNEAPTGSITINGGALYTNNQLLSLTLTGTDPESNPLTMSVSNDGSAWGTIPFATSTNHLTTPADGLKTVYYRLTDSLGLQSPVYTKTITLDRTAPAGTLSINSGAAFTSSTNVTLGMTASDALPMEMQFSNDGTTWSAWEPFASSKTVTLPSGSGTKTVYMKLRDAAGNTTDLSDTIVIDTTPPNGSLSIENGSNAINYASVELQVGNPDATAVSMQFRNESGAWSGWEPYASIKSGWVLSSGDGLKTVNAQLKDEAGNIADVSDTITLDTTAPIVTGVTEGGLYGADLTIAFNEGTGDLDGGTAFASGSKVTTEGAHTLTVTDEAGNKTIVHFTIDKTPPSGSIAINGDATGTSSTNVSLTISNPDNTAQQMQLSNDGITWSAWEPYDASKSWTLSTGDGTKTVSAHLKDAAGNVVTISDTIVLDTMAPVISGVVNGSLNNTALTIAFNEGTGILDGGTVFASGSQVTTEGVHTLIVTDSVGNTTTVNFTLDLTAPDGTVIINGGDAETSAATVDLTLSNPDGSAAQMRFSNDGSTWSAWETYSATKNGWVLSTGDGIKTVKAELKDAAGNVKQASDSIVLDTAAPDGSLNIAAGKAAVNAASVDLQIANPDSTAVSMRFQNESGAWSTWEPYAATKSGWTLSAGDGTKTVNAELKDSVGNVLPISDTITLDTVKPVISGVVDGSLNNADLMITFNEGTGDLDGGTAFTSGSKVTTEGDHTLTVTDAAGNATTVTFTLDKTAPVGTVSINGGAAETNDTAVTLTITNTDNTAQQMRFSNDGTTWSAWEAYAATKSGWTLSTGDGSK